MSTMAWSEVNFAGIEETNSFTLSNEVGGLIRLYGNVTGMVGISANKAVHNEIVSRITGLPVDDLMQEDLLDGVAELANMICGGMKTKAQIPNIALSPPVAIVGSDYTALWKTDRPTLILTFQLEEDIFQVHACF
jgi:CheY-specific phosphatase CheX